MNVLMLTLIVYLGLLTNVFASEKQGAYLGAITAETPHWFKESFLEFEEDVDEAAQQNRRVMIYFSQNGCPYCARLVEENFADPDIEAYVRQHFDGIKVNMWGDKEIISVGGNNFTEKSFAEALKVQYTPTLLFLNEQGKTILRLNGYYPPEKFRKALKYAAMKKEKELTFNEFMLADSPSIYGKLMTESFYLQDTNLKSLIGQKGKPLAIYFEAGDCSECKTLHEQILTDPPTRELIKSVNSVQLNVHADTIIVTPDGRKMSQRDFANELNVAYTPSVIFMDGKGKIVHRIDGFLKTFHFQSSLAYVIERAYLAQPSFQRYLSARGEQLREKGFDTDIWGYKSAYPSKIPE